MDTSPPAGPPPFRFCGGWLAPRGGHGLGSAAGAASVLRMRGLGVRWVAVGPVVQLPTLARPELTWGAEDAELRGFLRSLRAVGLQAFLVPRIESPEFFVPPYPFRADIDFASDQEWRAFHAVMQRMVLHYAQLAEQEGVGLLGLGLELKQSVRKHPDAWRRLTAAVRKVYRGR